MVRPDEPSDGHRRPRPRPPLSERVTVEVEDEGGMTHAELIDALRATDGLVDVTGGHGDRPNFHLRRKPFCTSTPIQTAVACMPMSSSAAARQPTSSQSGHRHPLSGRTCSVVCASMFVAPHGADGGRCRDLVDRRTTGSTLTRTESAGPDRGSGLDGDDGGEPDTSRAPCIHRWHQDCVGVG